MGLKPSVFVYSQHQDQISAALIDMMMPSMDGPMTLPTLQAINSGLKVILGISVKRVRCKRLGYERCGIFGQALHRSGATNCPLPGFQLTGLISLSLLRFLQLLDNGP